MRYSNVNCSCKVRSGSNNAAFSNFSSPKSMIVSQSAKVKMKRIVRFIPQDFDDITKEHLKRDSRRQSRGETAGQGNVLYHSIASRGH